MKFIKNKVFFLIFFKLKQLRKAVLKTSKNIIWQQKLKQTKTNHLLIMSL